MADREFTYLEGSGAQRALHRAIEPDMAAALDKPWEIMAEEFGLALATAAKIYQWHETQMRLANEEMKARTLATVVAALVQPAHNLRAKIWGLALSYGLATRLNGVRNGTDVSVQLGCTRALISHYKRFWDQLLGSKVEVFGKSAEACARMRASRNAFVRRQREDKERTQ